MLDNDYNTNDKNIYRVGMVTFLDVLGWKGIYKNDNNAVEKLASIIKKIEGVSKNDVPKHVLNFDGCNKIKIEILSISDTIVIMSYFDNYTEGRELTLPKYILTSLYIHSKICGEAIREGLKNNIYLRGATSLGKFEKKDNILLGEAIDEAADWHEQTDWIGVILSPKALMYYKLPKDCLNELQKFYDYPDVYEELNCWTEYNKLPLKDRKINLNICLNWVDDTVCLIKEKDMIFANVGSLTKDIAPKYLNTFYFIKDIIKARK